MAQHTLITCKPNHPHKQILIASEIISTISPITSQHHQVIPLRRRIVSQLGCDRRLLLLGLRPRSERIPKKLSWNTQNQTPISHQFSRTHPQNTNKKQNFWNYQIEQTGCPPFDWSIPLVLVLLPLCKEQWIRGWLLYSFSFFKISCFFDYNHWAGNCRNTPQHNSNFTKLAVMIKSLLLAFGCAQVQVIIHVWDFDSFAVDSVSETSVLSYVRSFDMVGWSGHDCEGSGRVENVCAWWSLQRLALHGTHGFKKLEDIIRISNFKSCAVKTAFTVVMRWSRRWFLTFFFLCLQAKNK